LPHNGAVPDIHPGEGSVPDYRRGMSHSLAEAGGEHCLTRDWESIQRMQAGCCLRQASRKDSCSIVGSGTDRGIEGSGAGWSIEGSGAGWDTEGSGAGRDIAGSGAGRDIAGLEADRDGRCMAGVVYFEGSLHRQGMGLGRRGQERTEP
jgi:hypothetical protein